MDNRMIGNVVGSAPTYTDATRDFLTLDTAGQLRVVAGLSNSHIGQVGGASRIVSGSVTTPADAGAYAAGDIIANSLTAASVVPITFANAVRVSGGSGRITGAKCIISAASGTIVISNAIFDLLLFAPGTDIPFAAGSYSADREPMNITAAAFPYLIGVLPFSQSGWRNQAGANAAAGGVVWQASGLTTRPFAPIDLTGISSTSILGVIQSQSTWTPGAVAQTISFYLDVDQD